MRAILCFDSLNDTTNNGEHLKNINNLYETIDEGISTITATIEYSKQDLNDIITNFISSKQLNEDSALLLKQAIARASNPISISRNLETKKYTSSIFDDYPDIIEENIDSICRKIISSCPYILYNDDFNDRPVSEIIIGDETIQNNKDWQEIFERIFTDTNKQYDLEKIFEESTERQDSILADVQAHLTEKLTKEWKRFSPDKPEISIRLKLKSDSDGNTKKLCISIVEKKNNRERFFQVNSRSKGFIWYYNFIMKILFNPKQSGSPKQTIFLLDEPGSYLHYKAQEALCKKLKEISEKEGFVIYCTHSPQLLDIEHIPPNNIHIVENTKNKHITIAPITTIKTKSEKTSPLKPVHDALLIPQYKDIKIGEQLICVEGIYDKYCLRMFCELPEKMRIFPGSGADSIIKHIPYMLTYQVPYIAIWDNDPAGIKRRKKATDFFGPIESSKFLLLPAPRNGEHKRRMEEMICEKDYALLKKELELDNGADYESIMVSLWKAKKKNRNEILRKLSTETKHNFDSLKKEILDTFEKTNYSYL